MKKEYKGWAVVVEGKLLEVYVDKVRMDFWIPLLGLDKDQVKKAKIIIE